MKVLQKLGKSLMLPVSVLPICGILMGIGYWLCPASMQNGEIVGAVANIGYLLVKAGSAVISNMSVLFAVGVAVGLAHNNEGTAGLAGIVSWFTLLALLSPTVLTIIIPNSLSFKDSMLVAFESINNPFIGILCGLIGSACYNKFRKTHLPDVLSFFSGKRSVAIITVLVSIVTAAALLFVWPILFNALVWLGASIIKLGPWGAGIYAFLNRLLIPTGLHHALNNVFWFDTIGLGDLTAYWSGKTAAEAGWSVGMYMSGFFPCLMFGIPGAALAIIQTAKPEKRKATIGIIASAAACSFLCGVSEPFEFAFMFLAFPLYIVYSILYGIFTVITVSLGFRAGFSFSAGLVDLIFSSSLPAAAKTWLILPIGVAAFAVFYLVFLFAIKKWNLRTPGREDDSNNITVSTGHEDNTENSPYLDKAKIILEGLGGVENIASADHCVTRLRMEVKDPSLVDEQKLKSSGAAGIVRPGKSSVQIVIGTKVQFVYDELKELL